MNRPPYGDAFRRNFQFYKMFEVTSQISPNKTVNVAPGSYTRNGNEIVEFVGANTPIISNPTIGAKWVLISLNQNNSIQVTSGLESINSPTVPILTDTSLPLALIYIKKEDTVITQDMIYDIKPYLSLYYETVSKVTSEEFNLVIAQLLADFDEKLKHKANMEGTDESTFYLNREEEGITTPFSSDAYIKVNRGSATDVSIRWNDTSSKWQYTNDGVVFHDFGSGGGSLEAVGTPGTYNSVTTNEFGQVVSGTVESYTYTLPNVGTPGTYNSVTTDANGRVISGEVISIGGGDLQLVGTPGTYNLITTDEYGRVIFGVTEDYAITSAVAEPGTYHIVTTDNLGHVTSGIPYIEEPDMCFWYYCSKLNTPINTNTVVITNHTYPSYGDIGGIYYFYDASQFPIIINAKSTFEKEKNDIIHWKYSFTNALVSYLDNVTTYIIPNDPNLTNPDYLSNTVWLYGNNYYQITLNEQYRLLPDGEYLTIFANGIAIGAITNSNQTLECMFDNELELYVVPSSNLVFDIKLFILGKYAESTNVYPDTGWTSYFDGWPFNWEPNRNKGTWKISATTNTFGDNISLITGNETITIAIDGIEVGIITTNNRHFEFDYNNNSSIHLSLAGYDETTFLSGFIPLINITQITCVTGGGESAIISAINDNISVKINDPYYTSSGILVAEASLYDKDLNLKSVSDPIYMILELNDSAPPGC